VTKLASISEFLEWDVRNWSVAPDFWLAKTTQCLSDCQALEIGSRNGGLSLWMALHGARVLCSDVGLPRSTAIELHKAWGVSDRIEYSAIDALNIPFSECFDVVAFKSVLGAVGAHSGKHDQTLAISEMHRALRKGGELLFAENLAASPLHRACRRKFVKWGRSWRYVSIPEMLEFLAPFAHVEYRVVGFAGAFGQNELQRNVLAILDRKVLDRIVPDSWRYIIVGIARK
jgi:SAM-dependent methyltransferase